MSDWTLKKFSYLNFRIHVLACCHIPHDVSFCSNYGVVGWGYHVYKDIWATVVGEKLPPQRWQQSWLFCCSGSQSGEAIVGHVPKKRSSVCSIYARAARSELIVCQVTGSRRFSGDLVQGHHVNFWSQTVLCSSCWNENFEVFKISTV